MGRKTRERTNTKDHKSLRSDEKKLLLNCLAKERNGKPVLKHMQSTLSTAAPLASATHFEDVPVLTICPYCNQKVVTKTHFDKKKTICFCCCVCHPTLGYIFKDVIHTCPKCNLEITKYNRFLICFRGFSSRKLNRINSKRSQKEGSTYEQLDDVEEIISGLISSDSSVKDDSIKKVEENNNDESVTLKTETNDKTDDHDQTDHTEKLLNNDCTTSSAFSASDRVEEFEMDNISSTKKKNMNDKKKKRIFSLPKRQKGVQRN